MASVIDELVRIVGWYAANAYGRWEGPGCVPFYCDSNRVGAFAVAPAELARGSDAALFKMLVTFALYQSRRDVDIMALQRSMARRSATALTDPRRLRVLVDDSRCELVTDAATFGARCSVRRDLVRDRAACAHRPRTPCHVKDATMTIRRMGDMGKIPTSAFLHLRSVGGLGAVVRVATAAHHDEHARAEALVREFSRIYRIGTKLATMFVSALSTPELAPGLTPWWPHVSGAHLVVVDANVSRVVSIVTRGRVTAYEAQGAWLRRIAAGIDLRRVRQGWPRSSPRLVQQALYIYRSRSNRAAQGDPCRDRGGEPCAGCVPSVCPFVKRTLPA